jgi:transposase
MLSDRIHSHYRQTLRDLPISGYPVRVGLYVRRLCCRVRSCPRRVFAERLAGFAEVGARKTKMTSRDLTTGVHRESRAGARDAYYARLVLPLYTDISECAAVRFASPPTSSFTGTR